MAFDLEARHHGRFHHLALLGIPIHHTLAFSIHLGHAHGRVHESGLGWRGNIGNSQTHHQLIHNAMFAGNILDLFKFERCSSRGSDLEGLEASTDAL